MSKYVFSRFKPNYIEILNINRTTSHTTHVISEKILASQGTSDTSFY